MQHIEILVKNLIEFNIIEFNIIEFSRTELNYCYHQQHCHHVAVVLCGKIFVSYFSI
jgi:hypothetical protein